MDEPQDGEVGREGMVEAPGVEPGSGKPRLEVSTCVAVCFDLAYGTPSGRIPAREWDCFWPFEVTHETPRANRLLTTCPLGPAA